MTFRTDSKGNGPAIPDALAGRVNMIFEAYNSGIGKVRDGSLKVLGVTSTERLPGLPDVPTISEQTVQNYSYYVWTGLFAPSATPKDVVARVATALQTSLANENVKQRFREVWRRSYDDGPGEV
jgi:tripartite-type tricarboxylate transporter receptor subunit TctC